MQRFHLLQLLKLLTALGCRNTALRRDERGDWRIFGRQGHVSATADSFQVFTGEGTFCLNRLPTSEEAETIRLTLDIPKKRAS